jgi:ribose transport system substrate-binding protein
MNLCSIRVHASAVVLAGAFLFAGRLDATPKIGVLLKGESAFWSAVGDGAVNAGKAHGAEVIVRAPPTESDIDTQIKLLDGLVHEGIQALVIAPGSGIALSGPVAAAQAKGIKLVVIDTALDGDMPVFIATNHTDAGTAAGNLLASLTKQDDEISILRHARGSGATSLREASGYAALQYAHPGIVVHRDIYCGTAAGHEVEQARLLLTRYPNTKAILASSTPGTLAMLKALDETKKAGAIRFVGFGFNLNSAVAAALERGAMDGWIAQLPTEIGTRGVDAAMALLENRSVPEVTFCEFLVITKANLHDARVQALLAR